jgi:cytochrome c5
MRERIAVAISVLATVMLAGLAVLFASVQTRAQQDFATPPQPAPAAATDALLEPVDPEPPAAPVQPPEPLAGLQHPLPQAAPDSARGRAVFVAQGCERCHSVERRGSPRFPLDGVGSRRTLTELRDWTIATPAVQDSLSASAVRAKRRYEHIPVEDMQALLRYMALLVDRPR